MNEPPPISTALQRPAHLLPIPYVPKDGKVYLPPPPRSPVPLLAACGGGLLTLIVAAEWGWKTSQLSAQHDRVVLLQHDARKRADEVANLETRLARLQEAETEIMGLRHQANTLRESVAKQQATLRQLKAGWDGANAQMIAAVEAVRSASLTTPIPTVIGPKDIVYKNVKVKSTEAGRVTIEHEDGTNRIPYATVPPALAERLKINWWPELDLPPAPPPHETVDAVVKMFTVAPRPSVPVDVVVKETETEMATRGDLEAHVAALRAEQSRLRLVVEKGTQPSKAISKEVQAAQKRMHEIETELRKLDQ